MAESSVKVVGRRGRDGHGETDPSPVRLLRTSPGCWETRDMLWFGSCGVTEMQRSWGGLRYTQLMFLKEVNDRGFEGCSWGRPGTW